MPSSSQSSIGVHRSATVYNHGPNYGAAFFQMLTVALLCTSLAQPSWLSIVTHTSSNRPSDICPRHLTLYQFFSFGFFEAEGNSNDTFRPPKMTYHSSSGSMACLTPPIVNLLKVILMLDLIAVIMSFVGFILDILRTKSRMLFFIRSNGLFTISTVLLCTGIVGLTYYVTVMIERENRYTRYVEVTYDYGFFTLSAAGITALLATASSLFKRSRATSRRRSRSRSSRPRPRSRDSHLMLVDNIETHPTVEFQEPPPPYSP